MKKITSAPIKSLFPHGTERTYEKGQLILYEGDIPTHIYYVKEGTVKMYDIDDNGNEKIISVIGKGDLFPILPMVVEDENVRSFHGSLSDVTLIAIPRDVFVKRLRGDNDLALFCLQWFTGKVKDLVQRLSSMEKSDTNTKLNAALKVLLDQHSKKRLGGWYRVNFPVSQQFLADMVGVTRESMNGAMKTAQDDKLIRSPKLQVLEINKSRLNKIAQP